MKQWCCLLFIIALVYFLFLCFVLFLVCMCVFLRGKHCYHWAKSTAGFCFLRQSYFVALAGLYFVIFLAKPPKCWDYQCLSLCLVCTFFFFNRDNFLLLCLSKMGRKYIWTAAIFKKSRKEPVYLWMKNILL